MAVTRHELDAAWLMLRDLDERLAGLRPAVTAGDPDASRAYLDLFKKQQAALQIINEMTAQLMKDAGGIQ